MGTDPKKGSNALAEGRQASQGGTDPWLAGFGPPGRRYFPDGPVAVEAMVPSRATLFSRALNLTTMEPPMA